MQEKEIRALDMKRWVGWLILPPIQLHTRTCVYATIPSSMHPYINLSPKHSLTFSSTHSFLLGHFEVRSCAPPCTTAIMICHSMVLQIAEPTNCGPKPLKPNQYRFFLFSSWLPWVFCESGTKLTNTKEYMAETERIKTFRRKSLSFIVSEAWV